MIAREITKIHETFIRDNINKIKLFKKVSNLKRRINNYHFKFLDKKKPIK